MSLYIYLHAESHPSTLVNVSGVAVSVHWLPSLHTSVPASQLLPDGSAEHPGNPEMQFALLALDSDE